MKRRIWIMLFAVVMAGTFVGCGHNRKDSGKKDSQNIEAVSTDGLFVTPEPLPSAVDKPAGDCLSAEGQLYTILSNREKWQEPLGDEFPVHFAVTDLDQNGRLEILISTGITGSSGYTLANRLWQISQDGMDLRQCKGLEGDGDEPDMDLYEDITQVVWERDTGKYYYGYNNYTRMNRNTCHSIGLFTLNEDVCCQDRLGYQDVTSKKAKLTYYQTIGKKKEIKPQEYTFEKLAGKKYPGSEIKPVCIHWFDFVHGMDQVTDVQLMHELEQSQERFGIGKAAENSADAPVELAFPLEQIDWEAYRYQMTEQEYQWLWNYMPALTGREMIEIEGVKQTLQEYCRQEKWSMYSFSLVDLTGDQMPELILYNPYSDANDDTLILSSQEQQYYLYDVNLFFSMDIDTDGIISDDCEDEVCYIRYRLDRGQCVKERIAYPDDAGHYIIDGKEVSEEAFVAWEEEQEQMANEVLEFPAIAKEEEASEGE